MSDENSTKLPDSSKLDDWKKAATKSAPGGNVDALNWITSEGIVVKPLYTKQDVADLPYTDTLPGLPPYIRGPQATMYAVRPWTIRQYAGFSTAEESNAFYRKALAAGGQCLNGLRGETTAWQLRGTFHVQENRVFSDLLLDFFYSSAHVLLPYTSVTAIV